MESTNAPFASLRRRWLQFSLRTALIAMLLAAVGFSVWTSKERDKQNRRLQGENDALRERLRREIGELEIKEGDRDRLHAIAVPTVEPMTWKWRIYVPPSRSFSVNFIIHPVSDSNLPEKGSSFGSLRPGEQTMTIALRKNESKTDQWNWIIQCGDHTGGPVLEGKHAQWISRASNSTSNGVAGNGQIVVEPGKPLEV
jgi:hypothetical protein